MKLHLNMFILQIMVEETPQQFLPAITVCPYNRINCSALEDDTEICYATNCTNLSNFCQLSLLSGCAIMKYEENRKWNRTSNFEITCPMQVLELYLMDADPQSINDTENGLMLEDVYGQMTQNDRERIGMKNQVMVKSCKANKELCSKYFDIKTTNTVSFGNCFGFNQMGTLQVRPGPTAGISIEFYLARDEFIWHVMNNKVRIQLVSFLKEN